MTYDWAPALTLDDVRRRLGEAGIAYEDEGDYLRVPVDGSKRSRERTQLAAGLWDRAGEWWEEDDLGQYLPVTQRRLDDADAEVAAFRAAD